MNKIALVVLFLVSSFGAFCQPFGGKNSTAEFLGGLKVDSALQLPPHTSFSNKGVSTTGRLDIGATDSLPEYSKNNTWKRVITVFDSATLYLAAQQAGVANGVATLDVTGKVTASQLPAITISGQVYIDTSQAQMLGHSSATAGALSVRTDSSSELFVLVQTPASIRANWHLTQGNGVSAFKSRTGAVIPRLGDYVTDSVAEGVQNLYYTAARVQSTVGTDTGAGKWIATNAGLADTAASIRASSGSSAGLNTVLANSPNSNRNIGIGRAKSGATLQYQQATLGVNSVDSSGTLSLLDSTGGIQAAMTTSGGYSSLTMLYGDITESIKLAAQGGNVRMEIKDFSGNSSLTGTALGLPNNQSFDKDLGLTTFHINGIGAAPSIVSGPAAGTAPIVSISGSDLGGYITITTGSSPSASAILATLTFARGFGVAPRCILIQSANLNAVNSSGKVYIDQANILTTAFTISVSGFALSASTQYKWYYSVIK